MKQLMKLLSIVGDLLIMIGLKLKACRHDTSYKQWIAVRGDKTLRLQYHLDHNAIVFDLGGYEGQWASDIFAMYGCTIHVFEPVPEFAAQIRNRFARNNKIIIHECGLSNATEIKSIGIKNDATSIYLKGDVCKNIRLIKAIDFLETNKIKKIDVMKINIEGGEYDLLEHLYETKFLDNIENIQVQFHQCVPNARRRMQQIYNELSKTHAPTYQFSFIWENWKLKNDNRRT